MEIQPKAPFSFELTVRYQGSFEDHDGPDLHWDGQVYRRVLEIGEKAVLASVQSVGTVEKPRLVVTVEVEEGKQGLTEDEEKKVSDLVSWLFGADQDLRPFYELAEKDEVMEDLVTRFYGLHAPQTATVFECLSLTVLGQSRPFHDAKKWRKVVIEGFGRVVTLSGKCWGLFPYPQKIAEVDDADKLLNRLGYDDEQAARKMIRQKARRFRRMALHTLPIGGEIVEPLLCMPDARARTILIEMNGVNTWTAEWVLMRGLARPDALPLDDPRLIKTVARYYRWRDKTSGISTRLKDLRQPATEYVSTIAQAWEGCRSFGTTYLLASEQRIHGGSTIPDRMAAKR